jgi:hypothetical protein
MGIPMDDIASRMRVSGMGKPADDVREPKRDTKDTVRTNIPPWVPALASFAIFVGIGLCVYLVYQSSQGRPITPITFFLALFMLLFALCTLTAMLFITSERFEASTGQFSLMIGGPAAIWFGGTLAIMYSPIHDKLFRAYEWPETIKALEKTILDIEGHAGWITYSDWKRKNGDYYEQIVNEERALLSELLENGFSYPATDSSPRPLLKAPTISTAFLYFPKFIVKFQMLSGERQDNADKTNIFYASRATDSAASPTTALLCAAPDANGNLNIRRDITQLVPDKYSHGWQTVRGAKIQCLLAALYKDADRTSRQDRILIDMKKFTTDTKSGGSVDIAVLNYQYPIAKGSIIWQMKGSVGTSTREVPLVFRSYETGNLPSLFTHAKASEADMRGRDDPRYAAKVRGELSAWLKRVDEYLSQDPDEHDKLFFMPLKSEMASELKGLNFDIDPSRTLVNLVGPDPKGVAAFHVKNATDVSVIFIKPQT